MARHGILRTWHEDRGFGFIAPTDGGREVFVHISAFPRDGTRPTVGESLSFELGPGRDGKPQALQVQRRAFGGAASAPPAARPPEPPARAVRAARVAPRRSSRRSVAARIVSSLIVVGLGATAYSAYQSASRRHAAPQAVAAPADDGGPYRCDGRTQCSQMNSCAEAKFFLANCPDVAMDGNHDGIPCERQWCTGPGAR